MQWLKIRIDYTMIIIMYNLYIYQLDVIFQYEDTSMSIGCIGYAQSCRLIQNQHLKWRFSSKTPKYFRNNSDGHL
jgi:hypothetical protein